MGVVISTAGGAIALPATSKSYPAGGGVVSRNRAPGDPGNYSLKFKVTDALETVITGYEWRIFENTFVPGKIGDTNLAGEELATSDTQEYLYHTYSVLNVALQIMHPKYDEYVVRLSLTGEPINMLIILVPEEDT